MNTVRLAVSVKRFIDYNPSKLCSFIERWAASSNVQMKVKIEGRLLRDCHTLDEQQPTSELLFLKVDYDDYPSTGNHIIEINQVVRSATCHFDGIECIGINAA